jgi:hypothetical protein
MTLVFVYVRTEQTSAGRCLLASNTTSAQTVYYKHVIQIRGSPCKVALYIAEIYMRMCCSQCFCMASMSAEN